MKTVTVVKMAHGIYVTRRWYDMNKGSQFFPTGKKPGEQRGIDKAREKYIKDWTGE